MNKYQVFQKSEKFGIKNASSKFKGGNKLKRYFDSFKEASQYCDFIVKREAAIKENRNKKVAGHRFGDCNVKNIFLELQFFKPTKI